MRDAGPSAALTVTTLSVASFGVALPHLPLARVFGFEPLPAGLLLPLVGVIATYLALVELVKHGCSARRPHVLEGATRRAPYSLTSTERANRSHFRTARRVRRRGHTVVPRR